MSRHDCSIACYIICVVDNTHTFFILFKRYEESIIPVSASPSWTLGCFQTGHYLQLNNFEELSLTNTNSWYSILAPFYDPDYPKLADVFVCGEALELSQNVVLLLESGNLSLKKFFCCRLQRERRFIKCAFGILSNKWQIFRMPLNLSAGFANYTLER